MRFTSILKKSAIWIIVLLCLVQVSPEYLTFWQFDGSGISRVADLHGFDSEAEMKDQFSADLDGDSTGECIEMDGAAIRISDCTGAVKWESPDPWIVEQAFISDLNRDSKDEVTLLVWRPFQTWPVDGFTPAGGRIADFHDKQGMSCQLVLIGWNGQEYDELWAGSALVRPMEQIRAADLDGDGWQELVGLEGQYDAEKAGGNLTVWRWQGFGFVLVGEIEGNFKTYQLIEVTSDIWIATE